MSEKYAVIGAGPSGLAAARNLQKFGLDFQGFEAHSDVGGLWNIDNPRSTVYESAHLISSKSTTEFAEFPMRPEVADYPSHREMRQYFIDFAEHFGLKAHFNFSCRVQSVSPILDHHENTDPDAPLWRVEWTDSNGVLQSDVFKGVVIANGTLAEPNMPAFKGHFSGELLHTSAYKHADLFRNKRVLIVGAGNSGCDIAVDAVHSAKSVDISMRRGYYFVPKYVFGKPADTVGGKIKLPGWLKQKVDSVVLGWFTGDPSRFGMPKPDYKMYESHPVVNSLILHHLGHGDIQVKADIDHLEGHTVHFKDGNKQDYDLILCATGYHLHYPFISKELLNWEGMAPNLYLNIFSRKFDNLAVMGMIEASGIGWQGRYEQGELMAKYFKARAEGKPAAQQFKKMKSGTNPDMSGGYSYLKLERMAYYVHKDTYRNMIRSTSASLG